MAGALAVMGPEWAIVGDVLAVVAPGQGSQTPGFLRPWLDVPGVTSRLARLAPAAGVDLLVHGVESDAETLRDTAVTQPLVVAAGLAVAPAVLDSPPDVLAGHSVGEFTAAVLAGVLTDEDALTLVGARGRAMADAAAETPTGMSAVLGGDPDEVAEALQRHGLVAANLNGAGQVVAAGTLSGLADLAADPPRRARVTPLRVAGAFHTEHMAPAVDVLARAAKGITPRDAGVILLSNADGTGVSSGAVVLERLIGQVSRPVRWDECMATMASLGVTGIIELPPAGALAGLAKRGLPGVEVVAVKTPDDLDAARDLARRHAIAANPGGAE